MQILVAGPANMLTEWKEQLGEQPMVQLVEDIQEKSLDNYQAVVCLHARPNDALLGKLMAFGGLLVLNSVLENLASLHSRFPDRKAMLSGLNALPTFLARPLWEVSLLQEADKPKVEAFYQALQQPVQFVADRVGMATPRVICMIINEAYFTVQEGTANKEDIDLGMKLGTNYPHGPFAWADRMGLENVYQLLEAVWQDTGDERYRICPLLQREVLLAK